MNCGCVPKKNSSAQLDLTGEKFGSLTALKRAANKGDRTAWLCKCDCGNDVLYSADTLLHSPTVSCGHVGVHMVDENCYRASIGFKGKRYNLGNYTVLQDAIKARQRGEEIHIEFLKQYCQMILDHAK